jgi:hypothetical protein
MELQVAVEDLDAPSVSLEAEHYFHGGVYLRKLSFPKGTVAVGETHIFDHGFILAKGKILVVDEFNQRTIIEAGHVSIGQPGTKRVAYVLEDCVMVNTHFNPNDCTDMDVLREVYIQHDDSSEYRARVGHVSKLELEEKK